MTHDGAHLRADLALLDEAIAAAVLCHPHPQYGGDRFNPVIDALFEALPAAGITTVRFDFRPGAGRGDDLEPECSDATSALEEVVRRHPHLPTFVVGYSFGAAVVLGLDDSRIDAAVAVAPPLAMLPDELVPSFPTLVLVPERDQFTTPASARRIVGAWRNATTEVVASADHFLAGRTAAVAARTAQWLVAR